MRALLATLAVAGLLLPPAALAQAKKPPYYASISAGQARMRTGPGRNYPASWLYVRSGLPIKVVDVYKEWRKIEDPGGTQGWMQANLLTEKRTAMITEGIAALRESPSAAAKTLWRAEPGVIGRVSKCSRGWCWIDVTGRGGYVEQNRLWGVTPGEDLD